MFDFGNYSARSKYFDDSYRLIVNKIKYKTDGVPMEEFVESKLKMYLFW